MEREVDPVTVPTPPLMESVLAPLVVQESSEEAPAEIVPGFAKKAEMTGGDAATTVTVVDLVVDPKLFVSVRTYVVVTVGDTV
jgi:hypothetical protein